MVNSFYKSKGNYIVMLKGFLKERYNWLAPKGAVIRICSNLNRIFNERFLFALEDQLDLLYDSLISTISARIIIKIKHNTLFQGGISYRGEVWYIWAFEKSEIGSIIRATA